MSPNIYNFIITFSIGNNTLLMFIKNSFNFFIRFLNKSFFLFRDNHIPIANGKSTCCGIPESKIFQVIKKLSCNFISQLHKHLTYKTAERFLYQKLVEIPHFLRNNLIKYYSSGCSLYIFAANSNF